MFFLKLLKNKYLIVCVAMFAWLLYFDKNDLFTQLELIEKCNKLNSEKEYYMEQIEANKKITEELKTNAKTLETFARETYLMKKDNEEVYVFVEK